MKFYNVDHLFRNTSKISKNNLPIILTCSVTNDVIFDIYHSTPSRRVSLKNKKTLQESVYRFDEQFFWENGELIMYFSTHPNHQLFFELTEEEMMYLEMKEIHND